MIIYPQEKDIAEKVKASKTLAYVSPVLMMDEISEVQRDTLVAKASKAIGTQIEHKHLYPLKTLLVSTGWNKNDDVFQPEHIWAARKTPEDTPFNLEHQENVIIGHITANWVVDADGNTVEDDEDMPREFHIITTAVLYTLWENEELQKRTEAILKDIQDGKLYVSMECTFEEFDYAVTKGEEKFVIPRNHTTAFLTKHLKAFGGNGVYNEYRVGRLLKSICFCGKGLVANPANPDSIIFNDTVDFNTKASCDEVVARLNNVKVISKCLDEDNGEKKMADESKEIAGLEAAVATLRTEKRELAGKLDTAELALASVNKKLEASVAEVTDLNKTVAALNDKIKADKVVAEQAEAEWTDKFKKKEKEADDAKTEAKTLAEEKAKVEAQAKSIARVAVLKSKASLSDEDAVKLEKSFASFNDEQFEGMLGLVVANVKGSKDVPVSELLTVEKTDKSVAGAGAGTVDLDAEIFDAIGKTVAGYGMNVKVDEAEKK